MPPPPVIELAAWTALLLFSALAVFQSLLALGLPFGHLAWGGEYVRLPWTLRIGSVAAVIIYLYGILCVLERAGMYESFRNEQLISISFWVFAGIFLLSVAGNLASRSIWEKRIMTPVALLLAASSAVLAMA
ncbi:hypothetical protein KQI65_03540 [bacterium]|nr:hypothetical protein [bacterium]